MPDKFTKTVIISNIIMALLIAIPGQIELIILQGQTLWINPFYIEHQPVGYPPIPTVTAPWPNLFTIFLIIDLAVNGYFMFRLRKLKADEKMK